MRAAFLAVSLLLFAGPVLAADPETNKKIVIDFYDKALNQKDFEAAAKYFGPHYIQHNPSAPDGIEGLKGEAGVGHLDGREPRLCHPV